MMNGNDHGQAVRTTVRQLQTQELKKKKNKEKKELEILVCRHLMLKR